MSEPSITIRAAHDSGGGNLTPTRVVIHSTVGGGFPGASRAGMARAVALYFASPKSGGSAHYVVDVASEEHCVPDSVVAWHAPPNEHSIGIEIASEPTYTREQWLDPAVWPAVQRAASRTKELCQRFGIPMVKLSSQDLLAGKHGICGHVDVSNAWHQSSHWDPGQGFPWDRFMAELGGAPAPTPTPQPVPQPATDFPLPHNEYFGLITGPNESHGGINAQEKVWVKQIQQKLQQLGYAPGGAWADGVYEQPTADAVAHWQHDHMPGTTRFGEVWFDDWAALIQGAAPAPAPAPPAPAPAPAPVVINPGPFPLPHNQYYGLISGPAASHGGYYPAERPAIRAIQQKLIQLGYVPGISDINSGWADGIFQQPTADAVARFQHAHMPGTTYFGQVWFDDWAKLFSL